MDYDVIWTAIVEAVKTETDNPNLALRPDMTANDIPGWDSLAHVRILLNLDTRLGVEIDIKSTNNAATLADLAKVVHSLFD